jgi:hypothetical protein
VTGALDQAEMLVAQARTLAEGLRAGTVTVADARQLQRLIRQAEGWLGSARKFLDPAEPQIGTGR